jgi:hypothetical protein
MCSAMVRTAITGLALALVACSAAQPGASSAGAGASQTNSQVPAASTTSEPPGESPSTLPTAVATVVDPCELLTAQEASTLTGTDYGAGKEATLPNHVRTCTYLNPPDPTQVTVTVVQAPDVATAQAAKKQFVNTIKRKMPSDFTSTTFDMADGGAILRASATESGMTLNVAAVFVLKGTISFGVSELVVGSQPASDDALKSLAQTVVGRLP